MNLIDLPEFKTLVKKKETVCSFDPNYAQYIFWFYPSYCFR